MILNGNKIYLVPISKQDTDNIVKWRNEVKDFFIDQRLITAESHNQWYDSMILSKKVVQFIIYKQEDKKSIGSVYLRDIDLTNKKAEYGIFIGDKTGQNKGYGREAAKLIISYGFMELKLHKIFLRVFADNFNAINSYKSAGFIQEAYLRDELYINNSFRDIMLMAILNNVRRFINE